MKIEQTLKKIAQESKYTYDQVRLCFFNWKTLIMDYENITKRNLDIIILLKEKNLI